MPVYEYACSACGHEFEEWQKITDTPVKVCPQCDKAEVQRLISRSSFHLKGGGWYSDLYASSKSSGDQGSKGGKVDKKDGASAKADKSDKAGKADTTSAKTESKSSGTAATSAKKATAGTS